MPFSPHLPQHKPSNSTIKEEELVKHTRKMTPDYDSHKQDRNRKLHGFKAKGHESAAHNSLSYSIEFPILTATNGFSKLLTCYIHFQ